MGYGAFHGAQFIKSEWDGFEAQQRYEDVVVIGEALRAWQPTGAVEFGTAKGGFAVFLGKQLASITPRSVVVSVDLERDDALWKAIRENGGLNVVLVAADLLRPTPQQVAMLTHFLGRGTPDARPFLYCDNGHKMQELRYWVPKIEPRTALVGVHDYGTEVDPEEVEAFMALQGFTPYWHDRFEALAHPEWYPVSLTRLWERQ